MVLTPTIRPLLSGKPNLVGLPLPAPIKTIDFDCLDIKALKTFVKLTLQVNLFQNHSTHNMTTDSLLSCKFRTCDSMNNLPLHCGLTNSRMSASDTDLPVQKSIPIP